jgi:ABC-2 type transport system permease protein
MNNSIALRTIITKEVFRFVRIWPQTLLPPAITTALYFLIFGKLIGNRIGGINGSTYMDYIVPGIILMSVISHSYANVVSSFYSTKFQRNIEELLVAPVPNWVILSGYVSGGIIRGLLVGLVVSIISHLFADIIVYNVLITLSIAVFTATIFALAGFINAVLAESFDDISIIPNFVLTPLSYLGGVFYSVLYMINTFRYGFIGVTDVNIQSAYLITGGFIVSLTIICLFLLHKGIGIKH